MLLGEFMELGCERAFRVWQVMPQLGSGVAPSDYPLNRGEFQDRMLSLHTEGPT